jgi:hypothetical protein
MILGQSGRRRFWRRRSSIFRAALERSAPSFPETAAPVPSQPRTPPTVPRNTRSDGGNCRSLPGTIAISAWREGSFLHPRTDLPGCGDRVFEPSPFAWHPGPFPCRWLDDLWADPARPKPSAVSFFPRRPRRLLAPASLQKSCPLGSSAVAAALWVQAGRTRPSRSAIAGEWSPGDKQNGDLK